MRQPLPETIGADPGAVHEHGGATDKPNMADKFAGGRFAVALAVAVLMVAAGFLALAALYLTPDASAPVVPEDWGNIPTPWTYLLQGAAPALLGGGFSLTAALLFAGAHFRPGASNVAKVVLLVLGMVLVGGGMVFVFAPDIFAKQIVDSYATSQGTSPARVTIAWPYTLPAAAFGLLVPGLAVLAGLVLTIPKRATPVDDAAAFHAPDARPEPLVTIVELGDAEAVEQPTESLATGPSGTAARFGAGWLVGGALLGVGAVLLFAPTIFPAVPGRSLGGRDFRIGLVPWTEMVADAAPSFILVGVGVIALALMGWITSGQSKTPRSDGRGVNLHSEGSANLLDSRTVIGAPENQ